MKSYGVDDLLDLSFYVSLRDQNRSSDLLRALGGVEEVQNANLFLDEEYN